MQFKRHAVMLLSANVQTARDFYVEHLGLRVSADLEWFVGLQGADGPSAGFEMSLCAEGHASLPAGFTGASANVVLAFEVEHVEASYEAFVDSGTLILKKPTTQPWGQRNFFVRAPDGVCLDIFQQVPPDPQWMKDNGFA